MPEKTANNRNYPAKLLSREARAAVHQICITEPGLQPHTFFYFVWECDDP